MWKDCFASKIQVATAALPAAAAALRPIFMAPSSGDTHKAFGYQGSVLSWLVDCSPPGARPVEPCRARCSPAAVETSRVENAARGGAACSFELRSLSEALVQKRTPSRPRRLPLRPSSLRLRKHLLRWRPEEEGGQSAVRNLTCVFLEIIFARL